MSPRKSKRDPDKDDEIEERVFELIELGLDAESREAAREWLMELAAVYRACSQLGVFRDD